MKMKKWRRKVEIQEEEKEIGRSQAEEETMESEKGRKGRTEKRRDVKENEGQKRKEMNMER